MPEPSDHSRQSERSNEDQLLSLKDRYSQEGPGRCGENRADDSNVASVPEGGQAENEYVEHPASMGDEEDQEVQRGEYASRRGNVVDIGPRAYESLVCSAESRRDEVREYQHSTHNFMQKYSLVEHRVDLRSFSVLKPIGKANRRQRYCAFKTHILVSPLANRQCTFITPPYVTVTDRLAAGPPHDAAPMAPGSLTQVILKFTTVADGNEAPSFAVGREGATVGRGTDNDICIPADSCMDERDHASIVWKEGAFHMQVQIVGVSFLRDLWRSVRVFRSGLLVRVGWREGEGNASRPLLLVTSTDAFCVVIWLM